MDPSLASDPSSIVAATDSAPAAPAPGPLFQCGTCKKKYKRVDHLARHVRSHTQSKPYPCRICSKSFGRADLLKRHVAAHDVQDRGDSLGAVNGRRASAGPGRVSTACKTCASCHLRCSEEKPCRRCVDRGLDCVWSIPPGLDDIDGVDQTQQQQHGGPRADSRSPRPQHADHEIEVDTMAAKTNMSPPLPGILPPHHDHQMGDGRGLLSATTPRHSIDAMHASNNSLDGLSWQQRLPPPPPPPPPAPAMAPPVLDQGPDMHNGGPYHHQDHPGEPGMGFMTTPYFSNGFFDISGASGTWTPMGAAGHMNMGASMDLDDIDLHFLNSYNTNLPFEIASDSGTNHTPQALPDNPPSASASADLGGGSQHASRIPSSNAFRNSYWKFQPNAHDHASAEEHNLSLPADKDGQTSTTAASKIAVSRRLTTKPLSLNARDKILTLVVDNCRPENLSRAVASFPSIELLDALIHYYVSSVVVRADSFIHLPSFNPNDKKAELLAAMAAAGAVLTSDPALIKLGSAIQECVRGAVPKHWERDNSTTRDLELSQAWMISLETAIWSGHSRKVEIAESFMQPLLTMLRRNARFRPSGYTEVRLWRDDEGATLEHKWRDWVAQESFKRLAFRMFQHDTDSSLALMINPLVSYAEVVVELPCSGELWSASNKDRWKTAFLPTQQQHQHQQQQQHTSPPNGLSAPASSAVANNNNNHSNTASSSSSALTIADCIDNPTWHLPTDVLTASMAYLSVVWRLAWEYLQLASLQKRSRPQRWNSYLLFSRHEELVKLLARFRLSLDDVPASVSHSHCMTVLMRAEHIALHIHAPFEDILRFAGMEGAEQSRLAYDAVVLEWMRSEGARKAVWHAGQILRCARTASRMRVQGPLAVIVFHASLVLWVYGMMYAESLGDGGGAGERVGGLNHNNNNSSSAGGGGGGGGSNGDLSMYGSTPASHHQHQQQQQHSQISEDLRLRPLVLVDDDESGAVQRFIQFDRGAPAIQKRVADFANSSNSSSGETAGPPTQRISLFEPDGVMEAIIDILSQNHPPKSKPPLVENLIQVLTELARSAPPSAARSEQSRG
ncbi:uncharacterized protein B0I36DRAFT_436521 [Microdochium trichocladiopsis]|uniref:Fungal-specific transcription factor domain-domain-containing protein n=1 Tax=Microdochium trichocladiopsis TaxID=1682393 RepID=A0A9P9BIQ8_9PEZI|nr:uncharacterized protein B0I36DRAFT_436521 [Microdochium trichocladiopsis]KAH7014595.1 hypothetical protein B0I36DRAFT_436521 [Microdochium trichocladiopsis]